MFYAVNSLLGPVDPPKSLMQHLVDEAMRKEEGNAQSSFEILFVFTDIFSLGLRWPISQREPVIWKDSLSGASPCLAYKRKTVFQLVPWQ
jgi:hypothetical protein